MAFFSTRQLLCLSVFILGLFLGVCNGQLNSTFYATSCPRLEAIVRTELTPVIKSDPRMGASLLRLFFHDCFVNGCDASVLLDDTSAFTSEKNAGPNANSARGFEVIDAIKTKLEDSCPETVSCADILALATRVGVVLVGGPSWDVSLGRRDGTVANFTGANADLPSPSFNLSALVAKFRSKGLSAADMTALSGAHTIGHSGCTNFRERIYNDANIDPALANILRARCPRNGGDRNLAPLDDRTVRVFDNSYYQNLVAHRGLLHSDQELFNNSTQDALVQAYSTDGALFARDFAAAMVKLSMISPLTGSAGQIRRSCRRNN